MGNVLSYLAQTDKDKARLEQEFQEQQQKIQQELDQYTHNYEENLKKREAKIKEIYEARKKIIQEQADELVYLVERFKELADLQSRINTCVSTFVFMILFNYGIGQVFNADTLSEWEDKFNKMYEVVFPSGESEVMLEIFDTICKISPLLPLVFPTGKDDNDIHDYKLTQNGGVDTVAFMAKLNGYRTEYITGNLKTYCYNVCYSNTYEWSYNYDSDYISEIDNKCKAIVKQVSTYKTSDDLIFALYDFLKQFNTERDIMRLKLLTAKSRKGICDRQIEILPVYYPKVCPRYELWEALLMIINTICYHFGFIQTPTAEILVSDKASKSSDDTDGGQCFSIPPDYIKKCYEEYYDFDKNHIWNLTDYKQVGNHELRIDVSKITNESDDEIWMKDTKVCTDLKIINPDETNKGRVKYVNPTQAYTYQLLQDEVIPSENFALAKIAVTKSKTMQWSVLYNLVMKLMKDESAKGSSIYRTPNSDLFYSFDYITTTPSGYEQSYRISPTCAFMYQIILADALQWRLVFPIDNTMTMSKINTNLLNDMKTAQVDNLPQLIWADNLFTVPNGHQLTEIEFKPSTFDMTYVQPSSQHMSFGNEYGYYTYNGPNSVFIYDSKTPKKDENGVFDLPSESFSYRKYRFIR